MTTEEACRRIHCLLDLLEVYTDPCRVPFRNGLYSFYEDGELGPHSLPPTGRVVRVGSHRNADRLVPRLCFHYSGN